MTTNNPRATIRDAGRSYFLRDPLMTNEAICLHLTGDLWIFPSEALQKNKFPIGMFLIHHANDHLEIGARLCDDEVVIFHDHLGSFGQKMLGIADFLPE